MTNQKPVDIGTALFGQTVVDSEEIRRVQALTSFALSVVQEAGAYIATRQPLTAVLTLAEIAHFSIRLLNIQNSCLVAAQNYAQCESNLEGEFNSTNRGLVPALAGGLVSAAARLPFAGETAVTVAGTAAVLGVSAASLAQLVANLGLLHAKGPGVLRIDSTTVAGDRHFTVYVPGTAGIAALGSNTPFDARSDLALMAGTGKSGAERATILAMQEAGIGKKATDTVNFVGYSAGAMVAANIAKSQLFNVKGVLTVGGPIANVQLPKEIKVVSIENTADVVPKLDLAENPKTQHWATAKVAVSGTLAGPHAITSYEAAAQKIEQSGYGQANRLVGDMIGQTIGAADKPSSGNQSATTTEYFYTKRTG